MFKVKRLDPTESKCFARFLLPSSCFRMGARETNRGGQKNMAGPFLPGSGMWFWPCFRKGSLRLHHSLFSWPRHLAHRDLVPPWGPFPGEAPQDKGDPQPGGLQGLMRGGLSGSNRGGTRLPRGLCSAKATIWPRILHSPPGHTWDTEAGWPHGWTAWFQLIPPGMAT